MTTTMGIIVGKVLFSSDLDDGSMLSTGIAGKRAHHLHGMHQRAWEVSRERTVQSSARSIAMRSFRAAK